MHFVIHSTLALQLLVSANQPNVSEGLKKTAISTANFAIEIANRAIVDAQRPVISAPSPVVPPESPIPTPSFVSAPTDSTSPSPVFNPIDVPALFATPLPTPPVILNPRFIADPVVLRTQITNYGKL